MYEPRIIQINGVNYAIPFDQRAGEDTASPTDSYLRTNMEFTTYVRKPFTVEATEVTANNIEEVAKHVGDVRHKEDGTPFILVDRRLVPNVARVYIGFFMTKMGENIRCYSRKVFTDQFVQIDDNIQPWLDFLNGNKTNEVSV